MVDLAWPFLLTAYSIFSLLLTALVPEEACPNYDHHAKPRHKGKRSTGSHQLPFQQPVKKGRDLYSHEVEEVIEGSRSRIADPDVFRLFENAYPHTLDTMVKWKGPTLEREEEEAILDVSHSYDVNKVNQPYNGEKTLDSKWELDSLASSVQLRFEYYNATQDRGPFIQYIWLDTVEVIMDAAAVMHVGIFSDAGKLVQPGHSMVGKITPASETTSDEGHGNSVTSFTGIVRSSFRPSEDATIFQFLIPSNLMFASSLQNALFMPIAMNTERTDDLALRMSSVAAEIQAVMAKYGFIPHPEFGAFFAYEVNGYGSQQLTDDANLPSLLSAPLTGHASAREEVYLNTRMFTLGPQNPHWCHEPVMSAIGGPHSGPMNGWAPSSILRIMMSQDGSGIGIEAQREIRAALGSTDGLGLIEESINAHKQKDWSRRCEFLTSEKGSYLPLFDI